MVDILQYKTLAGDCPFADWFDALDHQTALKVRTAIARIETGNLGDVKPVGEGVLERRIDHGPGYRIYFGMTGTSLVILLTGGSKQRQHRDISDAKALWADYKARRKKGP
jgi:putative addiction module killer protein